MAKKHNKVPYFNWREGRPRWEPGPHVRAMGFRGADLKDQRGNWLSRPDALAAAETLNEAVRAKREGRKTDVPSKQNVLTVGALIDQFVARPKITGEGLRAGKRPVSKAARAAYDLHFRILREWAGDVAAASVTPAAIETLYDALVAERGLSSANAAMRSIKTLFYWGGDKGLRKLTHNPVVGLETDSTDGRIVVWSFEEIANFVRCVDWLGYPSLGDAVILGAMTGQRRGDLLRLEEGQFDGELYRLVTSKTKARVSVPATPILARRIEAARKRKAELWPNIVNRTESVTEGGAAYGPEGSYFADLFFAARVIASGVAFEIEKTLCWMFGIEPPRRNLPFDVQPALIESKSLGQEGKRFQDLRDTAVTWLFESGCTEAEIATITGHSLQTVRDILDRHYFSRSDTLARSAGAKLGAFLTARKMEL